jgi:hypothetical protein
MRRIFFFSVSHTSDRRLRNQVLPGSRERLTVDGLDLVTHPADFDHWCRTNIFVVLSSEPLS